MRVHTKTLLTLAGVAAVLLVGLVTAVLAAGPPELCGSCHAMQPYAQSLGESEHADATCAACHAPGLPAGVGLARRLVFTMAPASLVGHGVEGPGQGVPDDGCASCHRSGIEEVVDRDGILVSHTTCAVREGCTACHGTAAHGAVSRVRRTFTMERCADCHLESNATLQCDACHSAHTQRERLERGPWQVTHGSEWAQTHGLGSLTSCGVCHPSDYCVRCHGTVLPHPPGFGQTHGDEAKQDLSVCSSCHETEALCMPCHTIEMPHPEGFLKQHSSTADAVDDPACVRCHDSDECVACHVKHVHPGGTQPPKVSR